jgi:hypothetical protein
MGMIDDDSDASKRSESRETLLSDNPPDRWVGDELLLGAVIPLLERVDGQREFDFFVRRSIRACDIQKNRRNANSPDFLGYGHFHH